VKDPIKETSRFDSIKEKFNFFDQLTGSGKKSENIAQEIHSEYGDESDDLPELKKKQ